ncbi:hypothetical protein IFM89_036182 [Coptis chinensis]|uniref:Thioredoxin domain-containing protein n=1 Tax=Coptis chinensis TaxID=261450 RepID=A0A835ISU8_9MAGN|nr:hypothetical protein IFM89_036182 [Coptis chinensis]
MASVYHAPCSLSCARLMAMHRVPIQSHRSCYRKFAALHLQSPSSVRVQKNSVIRFSFCYGSKKSSRSVKTGCVRHGDLPVVTGGTWDEYVLNSDIPVLVEFWAAWCGPCRMVHREVEEIAKEYTGKINCYMLKADEHIEIADKYDIKVVPVVVLFKNGEKRDSVTGTMPNYVYTAAIEKLLTA